MSNFLLNSNNLNFSNLNQSNLNFGVEISSDAVRRILNKYYKPKPNNDNGPSWLSFLGHTNDLLWSIDLFRTESIHLRSYWVMVIMDQFTRRIIGFAVNKGDIDGSSLCRMFNSIISNQKILRGISTDNDPFLNLKDGKQILEFWKLNT